MKKKINNSTYGIFTNNRTGKKLAYYPCPKNANSSAKYFFANHLDILHNFIFVSDEVPQYKQRKKNYFNEKRNLINFLPAKQPFTKLEGNIIKCCIVRDPIERFLSAYKNRILYHKDEEFKNYSIDKILQNLKDGNFQNKHFLPQSFFLGIDLSYYNFFSYVKDIISFEKNVNDFFENNIPFPKIQVGGNKLEVILSKEQENKIKQIYEIDYNLLATAK